MNLGSCESLVHLTCISLNREGRLEPQGKPTQARRAYRLHTAGGGPPSPSWGFVSVKWRKALATFDTMFSADQGWGQKQYIIFFFSSPFLFPMVKPRRATGRLVTACLLFIINQYAFKPAWPGDWGLSWANSKHFACALFLTFKTIWKWKWIPIRAAGSIRPFWFS